MIEPTQRPYGHRITASSCPRFTHPHSVYRCESRLLILADGDGDEIPTMDSMKSMTDDSCSLNLKDSCKHFLLHQHMQVWQQLFHQVYLLLVATPHFEPLLQDLITLLQKPATNEHYSLKFNILALVAFDVNLAEALCERPTETLLLFDKAALIAQQQIVQQEHSQAVLAVKDLVHVRVWGVPFYLDPQSSSLYPSIGSIRSCHVDKLITVTGTVVRTGSVTMIESHKLYQCARCYAR